MEIWPLAGRVSLLLVEGAGATWCYDCLATKLAVPAKDARDAAQFLLARPDWRLDGGTCSSCGRIGQYLVPQSVDTAIRG